MKKLIFIPLLFLCFFSFSQSVGIGTNSPSPSSSLDLGPSLKPVVLPRLTTAQMNAVVSAVEGMMLYNTTEKTLYGYMRTSSLNFNGFDLPVYRWQPVTTGPRMLAWGVVDSFPTIKAGSGGFTITWDGTNNWYRLGLSHPHEYYKDSMLLSITPVGAGSWDQAVATYEIIDGASRYATIKFTDISRMIANYTTLNARRKSAFHFVLYDLRKEPY